MRDYLVIRLYGPLASWGEVAVGESRHSADHPSRSALLGLLGAALGIRRDDAVGQQALGDGYHFAIRLLRSGFPLRDYHTVQSPPQQRKVTYYTRRQELADKQKLGTLLSAREYRCDSMAVVAIQATEDAPFSLQELADFLKHPTFPLYLGRKSCPLAVPLYPQIIRSETAKDALEQVNQPVMVDLLDPELGNKPIEDAKTSWPGRLDRQWLRTDKSRYYWEDSVQAGVQPQWIVSRYDEPLSRSRWQFVMRNEQVWIEGEEE